MLWSYRPSHSNHDHCDLIHSKSQNQFIFTKPLKDYFQLLALIGMIYGFVMIQNPEKTFNGSHAVEEVIHEEVEAEEGVADLENLAEDEENATDRIVTDLTNGTMDPQAEKYRELGLLRIQKHGIKGNDLKNHFQSFCKRSISLQWS